MTRDLVFISHANPEDNRFARWLTLRLNRDGYRAWCDVTRLLGGEDFWREIEKTLRDRTVKFIYVLSKTSNTKDGPLNELAVARQVARTHGLSDFIVPLLIDDLPHSDINIEIKRINAINFRDGWASGFSQLLQKLETDNVVRSPAAGADVVKQWWQTSGPVHFGAIARPESYFSNYFPFTLPGRLFAHRLLDASGTVTITDDNPFPCALFGEHLVSFAPDSDFRGRMPPGKRIVETKQFATDALLSGNVVLPAAERNMDGSPKRPTRTQVANLVKDLVAQGMTRALSGKGLKPYELASGQQCFYFPSSLIEDDTVRSENPKIRRQVVGYRTLFSLTEQKQKRHWHFALAGSLQFFPEPMWIARSHVVFSDDGTQAWEDSQRQHRARRRDCRNWWNDKWRDLLLGTVSWLAGDEDGLRISLGSGATATLARLPLEFTSPISYEAPSSMVVEDEIVDDEEEDDGSEEVEEKA